MARSITVIPAKQISTAESGTAQSVQKIEDGSVLPSVNRPRRTVIKL